MSSQQTTTTLNLDTHEIKLLECLDNKLENNKINDNESEYNKLIDVYNNNRNEITKIIDQQNISELQNYSVTNPIKLGFNNIISGTIENYYSLNCDTKFTETNDFITAFLDKLKDEVTRSIYYFYTNDPLQRQLKKFNDNTNKTKETVFSIFNKMLGEYIGEKHYTEYKYLTYKNNFDLKTVTNLLQNISSLHQTINSDSNKIDKNVSLLIYILQNLFQGSLGNIINIFGNSNKVSGNDQKITVFDYDQGIITLVSAIHCTETSYSNIVIGYFLQPIKLYLNNEVMSQEYQVNGKFIFVPTFYEQRIISPEDMNLSIDAWNNKYIEMLCQKQFNITMNLNIFPCLNQVSNEKHLQTARTHKNMLGRLNYNEYSCKLGSKFWANNICSYSGLVNYINIFQGSIKNELDCANAKKPTDYQTNLIEYILRFLKYTDMINNISTNLYITLDAFVLSKIFQVSEDQITDLDIFKISKTFENEVKIQYFIHDLEMNDYKENMQVKFIRLNNFFNSNAGSSGKTFKDIFHSYHTIYFIAEIKQTPVQTDQTITPSINQKLNAGLRVEAQKTPTFAEHNNQEFGTQRNQEHQELITHVKKAAHTQKQSEKQHKLDLSIIDRPMTLEDIKQIEKTISNSKDIVEKPNDKQQNTPLWVSDNLPPQNAVKPPSNKNIQKKFKLKSILNSNKISNNIFVSSYTTKSIYLMSNIQKILESSTTSNIQKQNNTILTTLIEIINAFYNIKLELQKELKNESNIQEYQKILVNTGLITLNDILLNTGNIDYIMNYFINEIVTTQIPTARIDFKNIKISDLVHDKIVYLSPIELPPTLAQRFAVTRGQIAQKARNITQKAKQKLQTIGNLTKRAGVAVSTGITKGIEHIKKTKISLADPSIFPPFDSREKHGTKKIGTISYLSKVPKLELSE
jgi:hypothetical protein